MFFIVTLLIDVTAQAAHEHSDNCDYLIKRFQHDYPTITKYDDLDDHLKKDLISCVRKKGLSKSRTKLALIYWSDLDSDYNAVDEVISRKTFHYYDFKRELKPLRNSLVIATKLNIPETQRYLRNIVNKNLRKLKRMSQLDGEHFVESIIIQMIKNRHGLGETITEASAICQALSYGKAESAKVSYNIIPAATRYGKKMKRVYVSNGFFGGSSVEYRKSKIEANSRNTDSDKIVVGFRFYENITCVKLNTEDPEEDLRIFYDNLTESVSIADPEYKSALEFSR